MKLKYPFTEETRNLLLYEYSCWDCGRSDRGLEAHHILGRCSNSPLNMYLICIDCHKVVGHSQKEESKYLQQTIKWLLSTGYKLKEVDITFYIHNKLLYNISKDDGNADKKRS